MSFTNDFIIRMRVANKTTAVIIFAALFRLSSKHSQWIIASPNFLSESSFSISGFKIFRKSLNFWLTFGKSFGSVWLDKTEWWPIDEREFEIVVAGEEIAR